MYSLFSNWTKSQQTNWQQRSKPTWSRFKRRATCVQTTSDCTSRVATPVLIQRAAAVARLHLLAAAEQLALAFGPRAHSTRQDSAPAPAVGSSSMASAVRRWQLALKAVKQGTAVKHQSHRAPQAVGTTTTAPSKDSIFSSNSFVLAAAVHWLLATLFSFFFYILFFVNCNVQHQHICITGESCKSCKAENCNSLYCFVTFLNYQRSATNTARDRHPCLLNSASSLNTMIRIVRIRKRNSKWVFENFYSLSMQTIMHKGKVSWRFIEVGTPQGDKVVRLQQNLRVSFSHETEKQNPPVLF